MIKNEKLIRIFGTICIAIISWYVWVLISPIKATQGGNYGLCVLCGLITFISYFSVIIILYIFLHIILGLILKEKAKKIFFNIISIPVMAVAVWLILGIVYVVSPPVIREFFW